MLKTFELKNFKSHRNTKLEFVPGVNAIVGDPDQGKTNIARAFYLLKDYRPLGFGFHSRFTEEPDTMIRGEFDDGFVQLEKTEKTSIYTTPDDEFSTLGKEVPDAVQEQINMGDINFQRQHDQHFLMMETPGKVGRVFNEVTGLTKLDPAVAEFTKRINAANKEIKEKEADQTELTKAIQSLDYLDTIAPKVDQLEELGQQTRELYEAVLALELIQKQQQEIQMEIQSLDYIKDLEASQTKLTELVSQLSSLYNELDELEDIQDQFQEIEAELEKAKPYTMIEDKVLELEKTLSELQESTEKVQTIQSIQSEIESIEECYRTLKYIPSVETKLESLDGLFLEINELSAGLDDLEELLDVMDELDVAEKKLTGHVEDYLKCMESMEICPLCGTTIDADCLARIKEEL